MPDLPVQTILAELLHTTARIDALTKRKDELRAILAAEARRRWEAEGAAPSWKVPRQGTATLAATDSDPEVTVTDPDTYAAWLAAEHPTEVEQIITLDPSRLDALDDDTRDQVGAALATLLNAPGAQFTLRPRPAYLTALVKAGRLDVDAGQLISEDGELVPGVTVHPKEPYLSVRLNPEAKARARAELATTAIPGVDVPLEPPPASPFPRGQDLGVDERQRLADALDSQDVVDVDTLDPADRAALTDALERAALTDALEQHLDGLAAAAASFDANAADEDEGAGDAPPPDDAPADEGPERTSTITVGDPEPAPPASPERPPGTDELEARLDKSIEAKR